MPSPRVYLHPHVNTKYLSSAHNASPPQSGFHGNTLVQESLLRSSTSRENPARRQVDQNSPTATEQHFGQTGDECAHQPTCSQSHYTRPLASHTSFPTISSSPPLMNVAPWSAAVAGQPSSIAYRAHSGLKEYEEVPRRHRRSFFQAGESDSRYRADQKGSRGSSSCGSMSSSERGTSPVSLSTVFVQRRSVDKLSSR